MNQDSPNQTEFATHDSWQDQVVVEPVDPVEEPPKRKIPTLGLILGGGIFLLVLLIVLAVVLRPRMNPNDDGVENEDTIPQAELTGLQLQVASLSAELNSADPVKSEFPFPPVRMDLSLPTAESTL